MFLPSVEEILDILKKIKDPETGLSIFDLEIVKAIDYFPEEKKLKIKVDFSKRMPSCAACVPIAWLLQKHIVDNLKEEFLKYDAIEKIEFGE